MSYLLEPMQLDFLNNRDRENVYRMDGDLDESFDFKYISATQIKHIIKDVKRQRLQKKEECLWASLDQQDEDSYEYNDNVVPGLMNGKRFTRYREDFDKELKRLKDDNLPERTNGVSKRFSVPRIRKNKAKRMEQSVKILKRTEDSQIGSSVASSAIEEEPESPSSLERSPISKLEYSVRKSQSERTLGANIERFSELNSDSNCGTAQSRDYENHKEEYYDVRLHPLVAHKILVIQKKISNLLDEISFRLSNIPLPDGDQDMRRRQQCVMEFAIRFSRNYLYDLGRQIGDIKRHVRAVSPNARLKPSHRAFSLHVQAIEQKLTSAHQLLLQALNAYCKHIPTSVLKGHPGKVREILQIVMEIRDICTKLNLTTDYFEGGDVEPPPLGKDTQDRCDLILSKLGLHSDNESQIFDRTVQSTPVETFRHKTSDNNKNLPARLSMYGANKKLPNKKNRNRKHVRSGRRPSNIINSVPQRYHPTTPEPHPNPLPKRDRTKIRLPPKEDEINTVMSILSKDSATSIVTLKNSEYSVTTCKESPSRKNSSRHSSTKNTRLINSPKDCEPVKIQTELTKEPNVIPENQLSNLVPVIADLMNLVQNQEKNNVEIRPVSSNSMRVLTDFLRKYRFATNGENEEKSPNKSEISSLTNKMNEHPNNSANCQTEMRVGPKNMQLICLPSLEKSRKKTDETDYSPEGDRKSVIQNSQNTLRITEPSLNAIIKYRDDYYEWSRTHPMYTSKSANKPWEVVAWIADKLVDELVVDVSKEFEMYDVIQKLFELEFKEF